MTGSTLTIAAVERDTGLSKDLLRVWERRYGFPTPERDATGERAYQPEQVARLRVVKRLLDAGYRPGRVLQLGAAELQTLANAAGQADERQARSAGAPALVDGQLQTMLALLRNHDLQALRAHLHAGLQHAGLETFLLHTAVPLNAAVADAWLRGQIEAFEERAYQQAMQTLLRGAVVEQLADGRAGRDGREGIHGDAAGDHELDSNDGATSVMRPLAPPRVLLTTLPGESQGMGLVLAEALLALRGCPCVPLGTQLAPWDVARAAVAYRADVVLLAFHGSLSPNAVVSGLTELRAKLPNDLALWAGGGAPVLQRRRVPGVQPVSSLQELSLALARWQPQAAVADGIPVPSGMGSGRPGSGHGGNASASFGTA